MKAGEIQRLENYIAQLEKVVTEARRVVQILGDGLGGTHDELVLSAETSIELLNKALWHVVIAE